MSCQHTAAAVHIQNKCVASSASLKNSKTDNASLQIKINYESERERERERERESWNIQEPKSLRHHNCLIYFINEKLQMIRK